MSTAKTPKDKSTHLITDYINSKANATLKHPSSTLSPPETAQDQKKPNIELEDKPEMDVQSVNMSTTGSADPTPTIMKSVLAPILSEIQQQRETVHSDHKKLHSDYARLEDAITKKLADIEMTLTSKVNDNTEKITSITAENVQLKKEKHSK